MFIDDLRYIDPTSLDDDTNVYDIKIHMPIPTFTHIFSETGVDMLQGIGELEATPVLRYMTRFTMNIIKSLVYPPSRNVLEFLIAKSQAHREGFIDTVCTLISTTRGKGISDFLATGSLSQEDLPKIVQASAVANGLLVNFYSHELMSEDIRSDY